MLSFILQRANILEGVIFMKKACRIIASVMLVVAIGFIAFVLNHLEGSFPWSNTVTYTIYGLYALLMVGLFIAPFKDKDK